MILVFLLLTLSVSLTHAATQPRYSNPYQGLFQCHADNFISQSHVKGGSVLVFWGDLQKINPDTVTNKADSLDRNNLAALINQIRSSNKKKYLHFFVYKHDGRPVEKMLPSWLNIRKIIFQVDKTYPAPWDDEYARRLKDFLTLLNQEFEQAGVIDRIEFIEPAVGGIWGAAELWLSDTDIALWVQAADCNPSDWTCLGVKFNYGINKIIDAYQVSFPKIPLIFMQGACSKGSACQFTGLNNLLDRYGMKLMYKGTGLGHREANCGFHDADFQRICSGSGKTKCSQEPWGIAVNCGGAGHGFDPTSACSKNYWQVYQSSLWRERISYYCMYQEDLGCSALSGYNILIANTLGAQINLNSFRLDSQQVRVGSSVNLTTNWSNSGSSPFMAPLKQGLNWRASSFKLFLEYVDKSDQRTYTQVLDNDLKTNEWGPGSYQPVTKDINLSFSVPGYLGGDTDSSIKNYRVYLGWTDPNGENQRFVLINSDSNNDTTNRRYLITDNFVVSGQRSSVVPTATPTPHLSSVSPTPTTPPASCSCSSGLPKNQGNSNCDSRIDLADFIIWKTAFIAGQSASSSDYNCDQRTDLLDFTIWKAFFQQPS